MSLHLRFTGPIATLSVADRRALFDRSAAAPAADGIHDTVASILARVRTGGDAVLARLAQTLDHVRLTALEVPREHARQALDSLDPELRAALDHAARNVAAFHRAQLPSPLELETERGVRVGRRPDPLDRIGVYAPGGRAALPGAVLVSAIPARIAGVREIVLCSPPQRDGLPSREVLAAAEIAGVDRVFSIGGAGAIGAMAFGTQTVPRVDRIVGSGNAYVVEAKRQVSPWVGIDAPAGPGEVLVLADHGADPERVALELIAQAERDPLACAVAIGIGDEQVADAEVARRIDAALVRLLSDVRGPHAERLLVVRAALGGQGGVLSAADLDQALAFASAYAPERLLLAIDEPARSLDRVRNAGTILVGLDSSAAVGDYLTGANPALPTAGFTRVQSGLSVLDFVRWTTWQSVQSDAAARLAGDAAVLATAERLPAHATAARAARMHSQTAAANADGAAVAAGTDEAIEALVDPVPPEPRPRVRLPQPRASLGNLSPATFEPVSGLVDLSDNTNLWGAPPAARRALRRGRRETSRYPSPQADSLRRALAEYHGVPIESVVTGAGAGDVIDATLRAFTVPGERLAYVDPTVAKIASLAHVNGLEPVAVPWTPEFDADVDRLLAMHPRVVYLGTPNDPTGTVVSRVALERVLAAAPGLVIVDRSYADFSDDPALDCRVANDSTGAPSGMLAGTTSAIVVGTLSRAFGLAGLRIGYALGHPEIIAAIAHSRGPYKIGTLAERAATAALTQDVGWVRERATRMRRNRDWFVRALTETFGLAPLPSHANFVLVPVPSAPDLNTALRANGVATQPFVGLARIGDALRITIGRNRDLMTVLAALRAVAINAPGLLPGVRERVLSAWPLGSVLPLPGEPESEPTPTAEESAVPAILEPTPVPPAPAPVTA